MASLVACCLGAVPFPAEAHAFGVRYDLPLPLDLYIAGAGGAVALSFVVMAAAFRIRPANRPDPWIDLRAFPAARALAGGTSRIGLGALSLGVFALILAAGWFGVQDPSENIAPALVWIVWWIGLAYVAALFGDLWPALNPWSNLFAVGDAVARRCGAPGGLTFGLPYPAWLGAWPAVILLVAFAWFELLSETAHRPAVLADAVLVYSVLTLVGMILFGRAVWLANGEVFSLVFSVFGRFAPVGVSIGPTGGAGDRPIYLRPYAAALAMPETRGLSVSAFVVTMLSTVTFDGFKETPAWGDLMSAIASTRALHPVLIGLHDLGIDYQILFETAILVLFPVVFLGTYLWISDLSRRLSGGGRSTVEIAGLLVFSLVPIAIAYHLAHYLSYLLTAGQLIIPLASDPFGFGWDLFGTADYKMDISVIGAEFVWYVAVIAIVGGHVIAVGVAHLVALRTFETAGAALRGQYPMLVLMVGYTAASLWILSQPIVGASSVYLLSSPKGRVALEPLAFREICHEMRGGEVLEYDFSANRPVDFNIHYHDGFSIRFPVRRDGAAEGSGVFAAAEDQTYCLFWLNRNLSGTTLRYRVRRP